jgi:hypothetical protein
MTITKGANTVDSLLRVVVEMLDIIYTDGIFFFYTIPSEQ